MSLSSILSSASAGAQAAQQAFAMYDSALDAGASRLDAQCQAAGDALAVAGIVAGTTVAAVALATTAFAVGAAAPVVLAGVAAAAAVTSGVGAAAQGAAAVADSALGQALLDARPRVAEGLQDAVELVDEWRGAEPRNPLLLPEPWRYMLSTLSDTPR